MDKVKYFLDNKGRVSLYYVWDGDTIGAFKSNFFPRQMDVQVVPKEENMLNEDLMIIPFAKRRKLMLRIGDGLFRDYEWKYIRIIRKGKFDTLEAALGRNDLKEITDGKAIRFVLAQKEKGCKKIDIELLKHLSLLNGKESLPLSEGVENEKVV